MVFVSAIRQGDSRHKGPIARKSRSSRSTKAGTPAPSAGRRVASRNSSRCDWTTSKSGLAVGEPGTEQGQTHEDQARQEGDATEANGETIRGCTLCPKGLQDLVIAAIKARLRDPRLDSGPAAGAFGGLGRANTKPGARGFSGRRALRHDPDPAGGRPIRLLLVAPAADSCSTTGARLRHPAG
jgi:hypothetical protein